MLLAYLRRAPFIAARAGAIVGGWWLLLFSGLTCVEIVGRKFGFTLHGIDEIGGYTLAIVCAIGFSYALVHRSHTRVDIVLTHVPPRARAVLNMVNMVVLGAVVAFATWRGFVELKESVEFMSVANSPLQTPMWLPQGLWFAGLVLFASIAIAFAIDAVRLVFVDWRRLNRTYGPPTLAEEIEGELRAVLKPGAGKRQP
jgi:TRAP-type C4-dicarboxylate transport system permease small subunit